jgi:hypothetical protein
MCKRHLFFLACGGILKKCRWAPHFEGKKFFAPSYRTPSILHAIIHWVAVLSLGTKNVLCLKISHNKDFVRSIFESPTIFFLTLHTAVTDDMAKFDRDRIPDCFYTHRYDGTLRPYRLLQLEITIFIYFQAAILLKNTNIYFNLRVFLLNFHYFYVAFCCFYVYIYIRLTNIHRNFKKITGD